MVRVWLRCSVGEVSTHTLHAFLISLLNYFGNAKLFTNVWIQSWSVFVHVCKSSACSVKISEQASVVSHFLNIQLIRWIVAVFF